MHQLVNAESGLPGFLEPGQHFLSIQRFDIRQHPPRLTYFRAG
jgi:hypothetical protein